jgi:apolipoprotein N-acyltransferase
MDNELSMGNYRFTVNALTVALATTASAGLYYLGTGLDPFWPLTWFAPLPVLYVAHRSKWWIAALAAFGAFFLGRLNLLEYAESIGGSVQAAISSMVLFALIPATAFALSVLFARYAARKLPLAIAVFAFPTAMTTYEWAASANAFTGSLLSISYSQFDFKPIMQVVALAGIYGVTFMLALLPSALATPWRNRPQWVLAPAAAVIAIALAFGAVRLSGPASSATIKVGLVASDALYKSSRSQSREEALSIIHAYSDAARELASKGAQVLQFPEKIIGYASADKPEIIQALGNFAHSIGVPIIVGASDNQAERRNVALAFAADGTPLVEYAKHHLVPGIEGGYVQGSETRTFDLHGANAAIAICKDNDFPPWLRRIGQQGAQVLFVPALDFDVDEWLHARVAMVRGIENGMSVARAAGRGLLTLSDAQGRVLAAKSTHDAPVVTLLGELPIGQGNTFYSRNGDWLGLLALVGVLAMLVASIVSRK